MKLGCLMSRIFHKLYTLSVPEPPEFFVPGEDDVFLVSYPRSGNTWMRAIMSGILYGGTGESLESLQYYVPDIQVRTLMSEVVEGDFHVVKSHFSYRRLPAMENHKRVVYLVRDPRDVVLSHYRYLSKLGYCNYAFGEFLFDWVNGRVWPCSWEEHVNSWTGEGTLDLELELCIIRYEDLLRDFRGQIFRLAGFLGVDITGDTVERVVASTSADEMRLKENRGMRKEETAEGFQFIGPATSQQWLDRLTPNQLDLIIRYAGTAMRRHGYI